jgi:hypothetical protein
MLLAGLGQAEDFLQFVDAVALGSASALRLLSLNIPVFRKVVD